MKGKAFDTKFVEVTFEDVPQTRMLPGHPTALSLKLETGVPVFLPGETSKSVARLRTKEGYLARKGFRVHTRGGEHNGTKGMFVWATKEEADGKGPDIGRRE